jgi:hypothetical protein
MKRNEGTVLRLSTLVVLQNLLQNGIYHHTHSDSLLYIPFSRIYHPLYPYFIPTALRRDPPVSLTPHLSPHHLPPPPPRSFRLASPLRLPPQRSSLSPLCRGARRHGGAEHDGGELEVASAGELLALGGGDGSGHGDPLLSRSRRRSSLLLNCGDVDSARRAPVEVLSAPTRTGAKGGAGARSRGAGRAPSAPRRGGLSRSSTPAEARGRGAVAGRRRRPLHAPAASYWRPPPYQRGAGTTASLWSEATASLWSEATASSRRSGGRGVGGPRSAGGPPRCCPPSAPHGRAVEISLAAGPCSTSGGRTVCGGGSLPPLLAHTPAGL